MGPCHLPKTNQQVPGGKSVLPHKPEVRGSSLVLPQPLGSPLHQHTLVSLSRKKCLASVDVKNLPERTPHRSVDTLTFLQSQ